jgi:hypothetical protein
MKRIAAVLGAFALMMATAHAHEPRTGPNGGRLVDAGDRYHVELVADGSPNVFLYLYDAEDRPIPSEGFSGNAILVVDGKTQRFALTPDAETRLSGQAPVGVPLETKGAIQLKTPDGASAQAKF